MLNNPGNSRRHHRSALLADHQDNNSSSWSMMTPMHGVEEEGGAVGVEGVGVEVAMGVMVAMETTKVAITKAVGIMTIKVDMVAMTIKVGMVVDMATTTADTETIKKMVDITEGEEVVCEEEAIGVTVEAMKVAGAAAMKVAGAGAMKEAGAADMKVAGVGAMKEAGAVVLLVEGDMVAVEGGEWVAAGEGTECKRTSGVSFNACLINTRGKYKLSEHFMLEAVQLRVRSVIFSLGARFGCEHNAFASFIM